MLIVNSDHLLILVGILAAVVCVVLITDTFKRHRRSITPELDGIALQLAALVDVSTDTYALLEQLYDSHGATRVILDRIDDRERQRDDRAATKAATTWDKS